MSVSKNIRKKRRQSKKRNMRGGTFDSDVEILSSNLSFLLAMPVAMLPRLEASEGASIYIRLMKIKNLQTDEKSRQQTPYEFIAEHYGKLFIMSCRIVSVFFSERGYADYCVAALQEMVPNDNTLATMSAEADTYSQKLTILASAVEPNGGTGLAYVIQTDKLELFKNKLDDEEWFIKKQQPDQLYTRFNAEKVAITDLGDIPVYKKDEFQKAKPDGLPLGLDIGRPMALIVRDEGDDRYTLHFNCHTPNPSALKIAPLYTQSILEHYYASKTAGDIPIHMNRWVEITHEAINIAASTLLLRFFTAEDIRTKLNPDKCRIIFSGDFNDGAGMLMASLRDTGLSVDDSNLKQIRLMFNGTGSESKMPESCCANWNSVRSSFDPSTPPALKLFEFDNQKDNPATHEKLRTLLTSTDPNLAEYNDIVNSANYALTGDGTGSNIPLISELFDPDIISSIEGIDYRKLTSNYIRASDHMPVRSYYVKPQPMKTRALLSGGGYRKKYKKRKSRRKVSRRKSKRYTKKENKNN